MLMSEWLEGRPLTRTQLIAELTDVHFRDGAVPKRTAAFRMLKGGELTWDFVEAVADVCSGSLEQQQNWIAQAKKLWHEHLTAPTPVKDPASLEVVGLQRQLISAQEELLKMRELYSATKDALLAADGRVTMLTAMVAQLESQITMLKHHQLQLLIQRTRDAEAIGRASQQLVTAGQHHTTAAAQLSHAQSERTRALELASRAAVHTAQLQDEVQDLRSAAGQQNSDELTEPLPVFPIPNLPAPPAFDFSNDVSSDLAQITAEMEANTQRLDDAAEQLALLEADQAGDELDAEEVTESAADTGVPMSGQAAAMSADNAENSDDHRTISPNRGDALGPALPPSAIMRLADVARHDRDMGIQLRSALVAAALGQSFTELRETARLLERVKDGGFALAAFLETVRRARPGFTPPLSEAGQAHGKEERSSMPGQRRVKVSAPPPWADAGAETAKRIGSLPWQWEIPKN
ncbi:hypothetical protein AB0442_42155 [Kitasatospora sp. NPDC085895]|uniref:hypothetical protein n=1 Tax=Kitasatospora sp. NPDC085895 TaxID=3155057 RepID=UPI0034508707